MCAETAALRDLWRSLTKKKLKRQQDLNACPNSQLLSTSEVIAKSGLTNNNNNNNNDIIGEDSAATKSSSACGDAPLCFRPSAHAEAANTHTRDDNPLLPSVPGAFGDVTALLRLQGPYRSAGAATPAARNAALLSRHRVAPDRRWPRDDVTSTTRLRHDDVSSPLPYHTAITRRPGPKCSPRFRALTQSCSTPLPQLMEGVVSRSYTAVPSPRRDLQEWENEIVK